MHKLSKLLPILIGVALVVAFLIVYVPSALTPTKPMIAVSRDRAIDLSLTTTNNDPARNVTALPKVNVTALLLRIDGNGKSFVEDERTLVDVRQYASEHGFSSKIYNRYTWYVLINTFDGRHHYLGYYYFIDANDGKIILKDYMTRSIIYQ